MARKKNIITREDAVTKDMAPEAATEREYRFPKLGVTVTAKSLQAALLKAKQAIKK